jgi:hypothetical protein
MSDRDRRTSQDIALLHHLRDEAQIKPTPPDDSVRYSKDLPNLPVANLRTAE